MIQNEGNNRQAAIHRIESIIRNVISPPDTNPEAKGHGQTIKERFPDMPAREIRKITEGKSGIISLILVALLTGFVTGIAAHLLKFGIATLSKGLTLAFDPSKMNLWLILLPVVGILLASIFQRYVIRMEIYHGEDRLCDDFMKNRCYLPVSLTYSPLLATTITLGFGGSAGSEGPIAYSGAAIGSNIAAWFRLSPAKVKTMMAIGAGAGIAGIFKAPVGGVLFTIGFHRLTMSSTAVVGLFAACLTSALTAFLMSGDSFDMLFANATDITLRMTPMLLLLGVFCGLYSIYYSAMLQKIKKLCYSIRNVWLRNLAAGLIIGLLVFLFPALYGEGYGVIGKLLSGDWSQIASGSFFQETGSLLGDSAGVAPLLLMALGIILAKSVATSATNSGGGVAGDFAPTLMAGSVAGFLFAAAINHLFGMNLPVADCVFLGMAGVMSGAIKAPLMSIFLVTETATTGYGLLLPVTVVAVTSYAVVCGVSYFTKTLRTRSPRTSR